MHKISGLFQVTFHVTFRCNARCGFCFNLQQLNTGARDELSPEEIEKITGNMPEFPWLLISGGEPFLREDLPRIIQLFYDNNKVRHVTIPTNGILSAQIYEGTQRILEGCPGLTVTLSFSLDEIGSAHDSLRQVPGCYDKLLASYRMIQPLRENPRFNVKFNTVVGMQNYKRIDAIIEAVRELKPDMHTIDFTRSNAADPGSGLPEKEELKKLVQTVKDNYKHYSGYANVAKHSRVMRVISGAVQLANLDLFEKILRQKKQVIPCGAFKRSLVLYPNGDASFCEPLPPFANIRKYDYSYNKLLVSDKGKEQAAHIKTKKCWCFHPCYQYVNILYSPYYLLKGVCRYVF